MDFIFFILIEVKESKLKIRGVFHLLEDLFQGISLSNVEVKFILRQKIEVNWKGTQIQQTQR